MTEKELQEVVHTKNDIIIRQSRRIMMLEEKFNQLRKKYFDLKYGEMREKKAELEFQR